MGLGGVCLRHEEKRFYPPAKKINHRDIWHINPTSLEYAFKPSTSTAETGPWVFERWHCTRKWRTPHGQNMPVRAYLPAASITSPSRLMLCPDGTTFDNPETTSKQHQLHPPKPTTPQCRLLIIIFVRLALLNGS